MGIKTIAVIGASELGCRMAHCSLRGGYKVILEDIFPFALEKGIAWIARALNEDVSRATMDAAACELALSRLATANSAEAACRDADLILEAVADEEEMKIELFTIFDKFAKPRAIFASTTTSFPITELSAITVCPERCIGIRFVSNDSSGEGIELVRGRETSEETVNACREVGRRMGKEVVVVSDEQAISARGGG
jgi:3-hydroxybutyryl-CoA dehydrogenase